MRMLNHILSVVAFAYLCYHLYTYGPGLFNVTVMIIFLLSVVANYFRYRKENEMKHRDKHALKLSMIENINMLVKANFHK